MIVLVDRQQGWREKFLELGIESDVWSAMTLHHIRRYLIENNLMERCNPLIEENNPLIVAYDNRSWDEILPFIDSLRTTGCIIKVNDLLFNRGIEDLIPNLQVYGRVMADLKSHDIPKTVANIMKHLLPCPPWAVTVHASGAGEMIRAATKTLSNTPTKVLAVTVLTSIDPVTCDEVYRRRPIKQVEKLAQIAHEAGAHGFVCSPQEVSMLKRDYPQMICVTPGIRSVDQETHDQKRVDTPQKALEQGSDYLVMGRQILGNSNPVAEVERLLHEEILI
ncbi:MAG: orotidine-5'-phosphate decarboxylase [Candidatus Moraniibacteriota bacterium]